MELSFTGCQNLQVTANDIPDLSSVESMYFMFSNCIALTGNTSFENWDVSNIRSLNSLFNNTNFNQNLETWNVSSVIDMIGLFDNSALSNENYEKMLITWSELPSLPTNVTLGANQNTYCSAKEARDKLINDYNWTINDGGEGYECIIENQQPFITLWKTDNLGISNANQITIPINEELSYEYDVDWGDGSFDSRVTTSITHTYEQPGEYQVKIKGVFPQIYFADFPSIQTDANKILEVQQWGDIRWMSMQYSFTGCQNLQVTTNDIPDLSSVENLNYAFANCYVLTGNPSFENWDVSNVGDLSYLFYNTNVNQNLENWNIRRVYNMIGMFDNSALSDENYEKMLIAWSELPSLPTYVTLGANQNTYCAATEAREKLITEYNWTINDGGEAYECIIENQRPFITLWKTDNPGISNANQITIPINEQLNYDYDVDWGDGSVDSRLTSSITHTYEQPGAYEVKITGVFPQIYFLIFNHT